MYIWIISCDVVRGKDSGFIPQFLDIGLSDELIWTTNVARSTKENTSQLHLRSLGKARLQQSVPSAVKD